MKNRFWCLTGILSLFLLCAGCDFSANGNLKNSIELDTSSVYTFFSANPELENNVETLTQSFRIGSRKTPVEFPVFVREGYHIVGWNYYKNPTTLSTVRPDSVSVNEYGYIVSLTVTPQPAYLVAAWETGNPGDVFYKVTFIGRDGKTVLGTQTVAEKAYATAPQFEPIDGDYMFSCWCTDPEGTQVFDLENTPITSDITLYSKWDNARTITFHKNDGSDATYVQKWRENTSFPIPVSMFPERTDGFYFLGWALSSDAERPEYKPDDTYEVGTEDIDFYAVWTSEFWTITFVNTNSAVAEKQERKVAKDSRITSLDDLFDSTKPFTAPTGYAFYGYASSPDADAPEESLWAGTTVTEDKTCYVLWKVLLVIHDNYDNGSGTETVTTKVYRNGKTIEEPAAPPSREEPYRFTGWYADITATQAVDFGNLPPPDAEHKIHIYAGWFVSTYTVTFCEVDGSLVENVKSQTVEYGKTATAPATPTKDGHLFVGWYTDSALENAFDFSTPIFKDTVLYAKWREGTICTVTFVGRNGKVLETQQVEAGLTAKWPTFVSPDEDGYACFGYYADAGYTEWFDISSRIITTDTVVYTLWAIPATITFHKNDGSGTSVEWRYQPNNAISLPEVKNVFEERTDGWYFLGWAKSADASTPDYYAGERYELGSQNITLYALWSQESCTVTVINSYDTSQMNVVKVAKGSKITLSRDGFTEPDCYHQEGFAATASADASSVGEWEYIEVTENSTWYALWGIWLVAHGNYYYDGPSGQTENSSWTLYYYGKPISAPTYMPGRTGYSFTQWYIDRDCTVPVDFTTLSAANAEQDEYGSYTINIYAGWETAVCTVTFKDETSGTLDTQNVTYGSTATKPADPTRDGHTFAGWYNYGVLYDFDAPVTSDLTLWTKWTAETYTVTFRDETAGTLATQYVPYGLKASRLVDPTRDGYVFTGWGDEGNSYSLEGIGSDIVDGAWTSDDGAIALAGLGTNSSAGHGAHVNLNTTIKVKVSGNAEISLLGCVYGRNSTIRVTGSDGTEQGTFVFKRVETEKEPSTYTYTGAADILTLTCMDGGNTYLHGITVDVFFDFDTPITRNMTLTARWNVAPHTVSFLETNGSPVEGVAAQTVDHGCTANEPEEPKKDGYLFAGWYADTALTQGFSFYGAITKDLSVYAKWDKAYTVTFIGRDGVTPLNTQSVREGSIPEYPSFDERDGDYLFTGYYEDRELTKVYDFWAIPITKDITLYTRWVAACTITFYKNDGTLYATTWNHEKGTGMTIPEVLTVGERDGYFFWGWATSAAATEPDYYYTDYIDSIDEDTVFYAVWRTDYYTITFVNSYNETQKFERQVAKNSKVDLALSFYGDFDRPDGWNNAYFAKTADAASDGILYTVEVTGDATYYVLWGTYLITHCRDYDAQGNENQWWITRLYTHMDENYDGIPSRTGYTFAGWYMDEAYTRLADFTALTDADRGEDNFFHVYAKWQSKAQTVLSVELQTIQQDPAINLTLSGNTFSAASGFASYLWRIDGTKVTTATTNTYTVDTSALEAGVHNVTLAVRGTDGTRYSATAVIKVQKE